MGHFHFEILQRGLLVSAYVSINPEISSALTCHWQGKRWVVGGAVEVWYDWPSRRREFQSPDLSQRSFLLW